MCKFDHEGPVLLIFSGLPGSGKSTLAKRIAQDLGMTYLRVDTIEQALRELCGWEVKKEGYQFAYRQASENLSVGNSVIADSVNPTEESRRAWQRVATQADVAFVDIEVRCSDPSEHRTRVEQRSTEIPGLRLPTWQDVKAREYEDWSTPRVIIDTAGRSARECAVELALSLAQTADRGS